jgi:hypothetical protein
MKLKLCLLVLVGILGFASSANATIQAVFYIVNGTYTVPNNKVLVLQQVQLPQGSNNSSSITLYTTNGFNIAIVLPGANTNGLYTFTHPLQLPAGTQMFNLSGVGLFGLLVDPADLYVGINATLGNVAVAGGTFSGNLVLSSAAPPAIRFESSKNLSDWQGDSSVLLQQTTNKTTLAFSTPVDSFAEHYYRASVRRR